MAKQVSLDEAKSKFITSLSPMPRLEDKKRSGELWTSLATAFLLGIAAGSTPAKHRNLLGTLLGAVELGLDGTQRNLLRRVVDQPSN